MQGFESCRDDSDFRAQGWTPSPTGKRVSLIPSVSALPGTSLRQIASFVTANSPGSGGFVPGSATTPDLGYYNTGITVNQAWTAGGFTFGFGAYLNGGNNASYGSGVAANCNTLQTVFDGTRYWSVKLVGATYSLAYSTDLINWTTPPQPAATLSALTTLGYVSGNIVVCASGSSGGLAIYYSANLGGTWSTQTVGSTGGSPNNGTVIATGNASFPAMVRVGLNSASSPFGGVYVGSLGGTFTKVASDATFGFAVTTPRMIGTFIMQPFSLSGNSTNGFYFATAANASLNTTGAWTTTTISGALGTISDVLFAPAANLYVLATTSGIWTIPNGTGTAGVPNALAASVTATQRYSTAQISNVYLSGSTLVGVGISGHIIASTDALAWTEQGSRLIPVASGNDWRAAIYDGTRYVLFTDQTNGLIATTPDLLTNYQTIYALEGAEVSTALSTSIWGTGLISATAAPSAVNGTFSTATGIGQYICIGPTSASQRTVQVRDGAAGAVQNAGTNIAATGYHFFELKCIKVAGTVNSFTTNLYIDGALISSGTGTSWAPTSDTTSLLVWIFQRNGVFTAVDDLYVTLDDGIANTAQGPLGQIGIVARRPTTNSAVQWVKNGTAATNALSVNQSALSSLSSNNVSSANAGDKDTYTSTDTLPSGYTAKAVSVEGYFARTSGATPTVNVGVVSGSTEVDSAAANIPNATPTYVSTIVERDPNGNAAWTNAAVLASKIALNHTA